MQLNKVPLLKREEIQRRVADLAGEIRKDYEGKDLLVIAVLKGALFFCADLVRAMKRPVTLDFVRAKSYAGMRSTGMVEFSLMPTTPVRGKHILIVEDILDTGRTTAAIFERLQLEAPASLALCALLDKPEARKTQVKCRYAGFTIEDYFVVGYGLDHEEDYRYLPDVYTLEED